MVYIAGTHLAVYFAESKSAFSLMSRKTFPRPCMKLWDLSVADACIYRNGHVLTSGSSMEDPGQESPQEEAADEDQGFSIQDVIAVNGPGRRKTWYPQTKHVHGNLFFCLNQWDRGCTLFFTMKGLELRAVKAPHTMSAKFVNLCKRQRQDICDEALHQHLLAAARSAGDKEEDVKRRTAVEEDKYIVGESIVLQMPQVERNGVHVGPMDMKCLWGVKNKDLWLELTNESLEYLLPLFMEMMMMMMMMMMIMMMKKVEMMLRGLPKGKGKREEFVLDHHRSIERWHVCKNNMQIELQMRSRILKTAERRPC